MQTRSNESSSAPFSSADTAKKLFLERIVGSDRNNLKRLSDSLFMACFDQTNIAQQGDINNFITALTSKNDHPLTAQIHMIRELYQVYGRLTTLYRETESVLLYFFDDSDKLKKSLAQQLITAQTQAEPLRKKIDQEQTTLTGYAAAQLMKDGRAAIRKNLARLEKEIQTIQDKQHAIDSQARQFDANKEVFRKVTEAFYQRYPSARDETPESTTALRNFFELMFCLMADAIVTLHELMTQNLSGAALTTRNNALASHQTLADNINSFITGTNSKNFKYYLPSLTIADVTTLQSKGDLRAFLVDLGKRDRPLIYNVQLESEQGTPHPRTSEQPIPHQHNAEGWNVYPGIPGYELLSNDDDSLLAVVLKATGFSRTQIKEKHAAIAEQINNNPEDAELLERFPETSRPYLLNENFLTQLDSDNPVHIAALEKILGHAIVVLNEKAEIISNLENIADREGGELIFIHQRASGHFEYYQALEKIEEIESCIERAKKTLSALLHQPASSRLSVSLRHTTVSARLSQQALLPLDEQPIISDAAAPNTVPNHAEPNRSADQAIELEPVENFNIPTGYLIKSLQMHLADALEKDAYRISNYQTPADNDQTDTARKVRKMLMAAAWLRTAENITSLRQIYEYNIDRETLSQVLEIRRSPSIPKKTSTFSRTLIAAGLAFIDENPGSLMRPYVFLTQLATVARFFLPDDLNAAKNHLACVTDEKKQLRKASTVLNFDEIKDALAQANLPLSLKRPTGTVQTGITDIVNLAKKHSSIDNSVIESLARLLVIAFLDRLSDIEFTLLPEDTKKWLVPTLPTPTNRITFIRAITDNMKANNELIQLYGFIAFAGGIVEIAGFQQGRYREDALLFSEGDYTNAEHQIKVMPIVRHLDNCLSNKDYFDASALHPQLPSVVQYLHDDEAVPTAFKQHTIFIKKHGVVLIAYWKGLGGIKSKILDNSIKLLKDNLEPLVPGMVCRNVSLINQIMKQHPSITNLISYDAPETVIENSADTTSAKEYGIRLRSIKTLPTWLQFVITQSVTGVSLSTLYSIALVHYPDNQNNELDKWRKSLLDAGISTSYAEQVNGSILFAMNEKNINNFMREFAIIANGDIHEAMEFYHAVMNFAEALLYHLITEQTQANAEEKQKLISLCVTVRDCVNYLKASFIASLKQKIYANASALPEFSYYDQPTRLELLSRLSPKAIREAMSGRNLTQLGERIADILAYPHKFDARTATVLQGYLKPFSITNEQGFQVLGKIVTQLEVIETLESRATEFEKRLDAVCKKQNSSPSIVAIRNALVGPEIINPHLPGFQDYFNKKVEEIVNEGDNSEYFVQVFCTVGHHPMPLGVMGTCLRAIRDKLEDHEFAKLGDFYGNKEGLGDLFVKRLHVEETEQALSVAIFGFTHDSFIQDKMQFALLVLKGFATLAKNIDADAMANCADIMHLQNALIFLKNNPHVVSADEEANIKNLDALIKHMRPTDDKEHNKIIAAHANTVAAYDELAQQAKEQEILTTTYSNDQDTVGKRVSYTLIGTEFITLKEYAAMRKGHVTRHNEAVNRLSVHFSLPPTSATTSSELPGQQATNAPPVAPETEEQKIQRKFNQLIIMLLDGAFPQNDKENKPYRYFLKDKPKNHKTKLTRVQLGQKLWDNVIRLKGDKKIDSTILLIAINELAHTIQRFKTHGVGRTQAAQTLGVTAAEELIPEFIVIPGVGSYADVQQPRARMQSIRGTDALFAGKTLAFAGGRDITGVSIADQFQELLTQAVELVVDKRVEESVQPPNPNPIPEGQESASEENDNTSISNEDENVYEVEYEAAKKAALLAAPAWLKGPNPNQDNNPFKNICNPDNNKIEDYRNRILSLANRNKFAYRIKLLEQYHAAACVLHVSNDKDIRTVTKPGTLLENTEESTYRHPLIQDCVQDYDSVFIYRNDEEVDCETKKIYLFLSEDKTTLTITWSDKKIDFPVADLPETIRQFVLSTKNESNNLSLIEEIRAIGGFPHFNFHEAFRFIQKLQAHGNQRYLNYFISTLLETQLKDGDNILAVNKDLLEMFKKLGYHWDDLITLVCEQYAHMKAHHNYHEETQFKKLLKVLAILANHLAFLEDSTIKFVGSSEIDEKIKQLIQGEQGFKLVGTWNDDNNNPTTLNFTDAEGSGNFIIMQFSENKSKLTAYWYDNEEMKSKTLSTRKSNVADIAAQLPEAGKDSSHPKLITAIVAAFGCTHDAYYETNKSGEKTKRITTPSVRTLGPLEELNACIAFNDDYSIEDDAKVYRAIYMLAQAALQVSELINSSVDDSGDDTEYDNLRRGQYLLAKLHAMLNDSAEYPEFNDWHRHGLRPVWTSEQENIPSFLGRLVHVYSQNKTENEHSIDPEEKDDIHLFNKINTPSFKYEWFVIFCLWKLSYRRYAFEQAYEAYLAYVLHRILEKDDFQAFEVDGQKASILDQLDLGFLVAEYWYSRQDDVHITSPVINAVFKIANSRVSTTDKESVDVRKANIRIEADKLVNELFEKTCHSFNQLMMNPEMRKSHLIDVQAKRLYFIMQSWLMHSARYSRVVMVNSPPRSSDIASNEIHMTLLNGMLTAYWNKKNEAGENIPMSRKFQENDPELSAEIKAFAEVEGKPSTDISLITAIKSTFKCSSIELHSPQLMDEYLKQIASSAGAIQSVEHVDFVFELIQARRQHEKRQEPEANEQPVLQKAFDYMHCHIEKRGKGLFSRAETSLFDSRLPEFLKKLTLKEEKYKDKDRTYNFSQDYYDYIAKLSSNNNHATTFSNMLLPSSPNSKTYINQLIVLLCTHPCSDPTTLKSVQQYIVTHWNREKESSISYSERPDLFIRQKEKDLSHLNGDRLTKTMGENHCPLPKTMQDLVDAYRGKHSLAISVTSVPSPFDSSAMTSNPLRAENNNGSPSPTPSQHRDE